MTDKQKQIEQVIDRLKTAYITSIDTDGFPNTKAMFAPRKRNGLKEFWLTTNTSSAKVAQFKDNPKACLYFSERGRFAFHGITLIGTMEVLTDPESKQMIWQDGDTMYYEKGVTDPDYCVLKFTATKCRYYTNLKKVEFPIE